MGADHYVKKSKFHNLIIEVVPYPDEDSLQTVVKDGSVINIPSQLLVLILASLKQKEL